MLETNLAGLKLRNPVILAAGTCGYVDEMADVLDLSRVGAVVTKSITALPREGNPTWRILPCAGGMLNAIGLANVGLDAFMADFGPRLAGCPCPVIGSIAGFSVEEYVKVAAAFNSLESLHAVELNVSCPNVHGGTDFGADPKALGELVGAVRAVCTRVKLFVKLPPLAVATPSASMVSLARAAIEGEGKGIGSESRATQSRGTRSRPGADALCLANTIPAMAIDVNTRRPVLANTTGGLSGPAVHAVAVKLVHDVYRAVARDTDTPLIGIGGVLKWEHAAEFVLAGASAVEMGTALFVDPRSPLRVIDGLERWVREQGAGSIGELVGRVESNR